VAAAFAESGLGEGFRMPDAGAGDTHRAASRGRRFAGGSEKRAAYEAKVAGSKANNSLRTQRSPSWTSRNVRQRASTR
jgi:hypothetical protein